jgi:hypothetical protein
MGIMEAVFALLGLAAVVVFVARWVYSDPPAAQVEEDVAAPYRDALHASVRIQRAAQEFEQQIYAEAARHAEPGGQDS